ncbi:MAG: peptidase T [Acidobacteriota bacterium]
MISPQIRQFLARDVEARFLRYVQVHTTSDPRSLAVPSTRVQMDLLRILADELREIGLVDVELAAAGFVYATLPASDGAGGQSFGLLAHVDTSPDQPGEGVEPICHRQWDGSPIRFPKDSNLELTVADSPDLAHFRGDTIITAAGDTLLGADDKAGVAEIMTAIAALQRFPQLPHGEIRLCFTSDEEIGRGIEGIDLSRLPTSCYTLDGSFPGELEDECFDAWRVTLAVRGVGVHPGYAKDRMINAAAVAARLVSQLPADETPERTAERQGFYHLGRIEGGNEEATVHLLVRDFEIEENERRIAYLRQLASSFEVRYPGLGIHVEVTHQYQNMRDVLSRHRLIVERAEGAIGDTGLEVRRKAIRGGTDGSLLTAQGHPTPNIFAGGLLFHSRREWIASSSLAKAAETILHLARRWAE